MSPIFLWNSEYRIFNRAMLFAYKKCQCTSSLCFLWHTVLNELGVLLNKAVIRSGLLNSMFPQFLCAEPAGLVSVTQNRTAWDKLLFPSRLIQPWWWVGAHTVHASKYKFPFSVLLCERWKTFYSSLLTAQQRRMGPCSIITFYLVGR